MDTKHSAPHPDHPEYVISVSRGRWSWNYSVTGPRGEEITMAAGFTTRAEARYVAERDVSYVLGTPGQSFEGPAAG